MTTTTAGPTAAPSTAPEVRARPAGFVADLVTVAGRALRQIPREPEAVVPAIVVPLFFFFVNLGALERFTEGAGVVSDFKAFQLPVAIVFAVTGISRASTLVIDVQGGYFDRLLVTPVKRRALLLGLMVSDFALVLALSIPVVVLGLLLGVRFETGPLGILVFLLLSAAWGVAFTGFPYAIALKTGNPGAVAASFILFFPFAFLTSSFVPASAMTGWMKTVSVYNPVTYLLDALRSITTEGWVADDLVKALVAVGAVALVSQTLGFLALRGRVKRS
ncbi:MAG: ABC transporter permease [Acidimicrobiia bacterium]